MTARQVYEPATDRRENEELLTALNRNCTCERTWSGARITTCPGHAALGAGPSFVTHLLYARGLRARLVAEEWMTGTARVSSDGLVLERLPSGEYAWLRA